jgi:hypothetical protein
LANCQYQTRLFSTATTGGGLLFPEIKFQRIELRSRPGRRQAFVHRQTGRVPQAEMKDDSFRQGFD